MNLSGEPAEQVVRISLNGIELMARISGKAAERLAVLLYTALKDQKKTRGRMRLTGLLKSGKELKVFAIRDEHLRMFTQEAKKYGVLYCVLKDNQAKDGLTDILVRADDAAKINRIYERFGLAAVDRNTLTAAIREGVPVKDPDGDKEEFFSAVLAGDGKNPGKVRTEESHLFGPSSGDRQRKDGVRPFRYEGGKDRPSVREELTEIYRGRHRSPGRVRTRGKGAR
ncbi:MAG: PcfB family protein [Clostridia bacterium]|nr:PcfB family protein [Clostridia bacterium]